MKKRRGLKQGKVAQIGSIGGFKYGGKFEKKQKVRERRRVEKEAVRQGREEEIERDKKYRSYTT